jgi:hypothetical protein
MEHSIHPTFRRYRGGLLKPTTRAIEKIPKLPATSFARGCWKVEIDDNAQACMAFDNVIQDRIPAHARICCGDGSNCLHRLNLRLFRLP